MSIHTISAFVLSQARADLAITCRSAKPVTTGDGVDEIVLGTSMTKLEDATGRRLALKREQK